MARSRKTNPQASRVDGPVMRGFHVMAKPVGPACNLRCEYCFYREKKKFLPGNEARRMSDEILEAYTREVIASQPGPSVTFEWQGGEPCLAGIDFFKRALDLQKKYGKKKRIANSFQTNGTLLDESWCIFLRKNNFLVGLSLDGPEDVHDAYRVDNDGRPTSGKVLRGLELLKEYGVEVNVLATVNRESAKRPLEVYRFFKHHEVRFIQFIPIVEREADPEAEKWGIPLAAPPSLTREEKSTTVTPWSVEPGQYGSFLSRVFEEWVGNDVGRIFVMNFEWALGAWAGVGAGVCHVAPLCGRNLIMEYNGDVFSCDHFMYPSYRLGNILDGRLGRMVESKKQIAFGAAKETALPGVCRDCDVLFACRGGCPKHRFAKSPDGEPGLNYLCPGFREFYRTVAPAMERMVDFLHKGIPVEKIMESCSV